MYTFAASATKEKCHGDVHSQQIEGSLNIRDKLQCVARMPGRQTRDKPADDFQPDQRDQLQGAACNVAASQRYSDRQAGLVRDCGKRACPKRVM